MREDVENDPKRFWWKNLCSTCLNERNTFSSQWCCFFLIWYLNAFLNVSKCDQRFCCLQQNNNFGSTELNVICDVYDLIKKQTEFSVTRIHHKILHYIIVCHTNYIRFRAVVILCTRNCLWTIFPLIHDHIYIRKRQIS